MSGWQDVRYSARLLAKEWGAALVIVITLALAIAANVTVFGFVELLLLRPLPVSNAARLVSIYGNDPRQDQSRERLSIAEFLDVRAQSRSLDAVAAATQRQLSLTGGGEAVPVLASVVTPNLHGVWGVSAFTGRTLMVDDDQPDRRDVVVLSHRFWAAHFGGDSSVVGRTIALNGHRYTIVGVLSASIEIGNVSDIDVWLPLDTTQPGRRSDRTLRLYGLLKPGVSLAAASAELNAIGEQLGRAYPATNAGRRLFAITLRDSIAGGDTWLVLALLAIIVGLVLVVACANVATVMLARASARRREIAVRVALGATRVRLIRQLVAEGLLLGLASGAVGLLLAYGGLAAFKAASAESFFQRLAINVNVLTFTFALSVVSPILFGVLPALHLSRPDLNDDLKDGGRDGSSSVRGNRSRAVLVVAQVAFALAVLIVSGLIVRTIIAMKHATLGFSPDGVVTMRIRLDPPKYVDDGVRVRLVESALDRLTRVPGVVAAAAMASVPIVEGEAVRRFTIAGQPPRQPADTPWAMEAATFGDYPRTLGLAIADGRMWRPDDRAASWAVAVVNREAVRRYWAPRSPIGDSITLVDAGSPATAGGIRIVGVVDDVLGVEVDRPAPPRIYLPLARQPFTSIAFAVRAAGDAATLGGAVRDSLRAIDRDLAMTDVTPLSRRLEVALRETELLVALFVAFAAIGLVVAIAGIYGVTAFAVGQRRHEIGVRLALGATGADVLRLIIGGSARLFAAGIVLGVLVGWSLAAAMRSLLTGVGAADPLTYATVIAVLTISASAASYLPAHRVLAIDPATVLKRD